MNVEGFGPRVVFTIGGIPITETVTVTWFIMVVLTVFSYFATRNLKKVPGKFQAVVELLVKTINDLTKSTMGENKIGFAPYMGTILIFLAVANISGLFGLRPPTADVNTTVALAMITFFMIHGFGMKTKGVGTYLKGFLDPFPALLPLNVIGELATPISLSFRLFGNIVGGVIIMSLIYGGLASLSNSLGLSIPVLQAVIPAPLHIYFDLFAGILQSFIFVMLSMVFVSNAMD